MGDKVKKGDCERRRFFRALFCCLVFLVILILLAVLIIYLVLRPTKPKFALQDATINQLNLSQPDANQLRTTLQVTLRSRNPNNRIGIYYDKLDVYAEYKSQQITLPTAISSIYQGHKDVTIWSPFLYGTDVPIAPYLSVAITQDKAAGLILLHIKVDGKLRWKVGTWTSGHYHIHVRCPAFLTVDRGNLTDSASFRFQQITGCTVDV